MNVWIFRFKQILKYGWKDSYPLSIEAKKYRCIIYLDIIISFLKYNLWSNQYRAERFWTLSRKERVEKSEKYKLENGKRDAYVKKRYNNRIFLSKYTAFKYENSPELQKKRKDAYTKEFHAGKNLSVQSEVTIMMVHYSDGNIEIGDNVLLARGVDIDTTGGVVLSNNVKLSEGVKILSHNHEIDGCCYDDSKERSCVNTPIILHENVWVGARAIIMPGVSEIGKYAMISAGAVVYKKVPPYSVVMGNPAKIVGFICTPEEAYENECALYPPEKRLQKEFLEKNYDKYFIKRIKEIKEFTRL